MFRIDDPSAAITLPIPEAAGAEGYWTEGNPVTNTPATLERASWFNMVQEELRNIVLAGGGVPSKTTYNQVLLSIENLIEVRAGNYALDTGAANAYVIALNPAVTVYTNGMVVRAKVANANTGASTLNAGGGVVPLVNDVGSPLAAGDLPAGSVFAAAYDSALNKFLITSLVPSQAITQAQADTRYTPIAFSQFGTTITANTTLTAVQSGMTFEISAGIVTLPSAATGLRFRFVGTGSGAGVIAAPAGGINYPDGSSVISANTVPITALTTWEVICDGTTWIITNTSGQVITKKAMASNQAVNLGQVMGSLQTAQNVTTSRALNTTYTNSTGRPIEIILQLNAAAASVFNFNRGGTLFQQLGEPSANGQSAANFIVLDGETYSVTVGSGTGSLVYWWEIR